MKKNKIKALVSLTLATLMLLAGCAGNGGGGNGGDNKGGNKPSGEPTGGYREEELKMPVGYTQMTNTLFLPDGSMMMVGQRYQSYDDGGVAMPEPMPVDPAVSEPASEEPAEAEGADSKEAQPSDAAVPEATDAPAEAEVTDAPADVETPTEAIDPEKPPVDSEWEYVQPQQLYDIITWKDITAEPTIDPLDLPQSMNLYNNQSLMVGADGKPALVMAGYDEQKGMQKYSVLSLPEPKGAGADAAPVAPTSEMALDLGDIYPNTIGVLANGDVVVCDYAGIKIFDKTGKKSKDLATSGYVYQMTITDNHLIALDGQNSEMVYYDVQTYAEAYRVSVSRGVMNNINSMKAMEDGSIYFFGQDGVRFMEAPKKEGEKMVASEVQMVLNNMDYKLAEPSLYADSYSISSDKRIVVTGNANDGGGMIYRSAVRMAAGQAVAVSDSSSEEYTGPVRFGFIYTWDPTVDFSNKVELEISTLFADQMLRVAAAIFRESHPEVRIKITQYYDKMEDDMKWSDFIKAVNTDILSGKGADVMFLDNMPINSYMRRGVLVDLSEYVEQMGGAEKLNMGVIDGLRSDNGKLYAMPLMFSTYTLNGRKNVVDQVTDLQSLLKLNLNPGQYPLASMNRSELFNLLLTANMPAFIDEKTGNYRFDSEDFIGFLELFDRIYKEAQIVPPELPENPTDADYQNFDWSKMYNDNQMNLYKGTAAMQMGYFSGIDYLDFTIVGGKDADWTFLPTIKDLGGAVYNPRTLMGINAKSDQKELAAEFIKVMFSGDERIVNNMWDGFSTVKSVQETRIQTLLTRYKEQDEYGWSNDVWIGDNGEIKVPSYRFTEQQLRDMVAKLEECRIPAIYDNTLMEFMMEEINPFIYQTKSATEVAQALQKRAAAYLAE